VKGILGISMYRYFVFWGAMLLIVGGGVEAQQTPVQPEAEPEAVNDVEDVAVEPEAPEPTAPDTGVRTISPRGGEVGIHGEGVYQPFLRKPMEFRDVPDEGDTLTLETPEQPIPAIPGLRSFAFAIYLSSPQLPVLCIISIRLSDLPDAMPAACLQALVGRPVPAGSFQ